MNDFFRGLEGLHEGTVKMETGHLNLLEGGSERLDEHGSTSLERSDKKLEASMSSWLEGSTENADCSILEILEGEPSKTENAIWGSLDGGLESLDGSLLDSFEGHIEKVDESVLGSLGNAEKTKMSAGEILKAGFDWLTDRMLDSYEKQFGDILTDLDKLYGPNTTVEIDGILCETDDNGNIFKIDGDLVPESQYEINGIIYQTDKNGEILSWKGDPSYHPENERNIGAQIAAGGSDRLENDDGGHLEARILGGAPGKENLVAMRSTINRGDWKCAENEIAGVLQRGGKVEDEGFIIREGNDSRPTKIVREYAYENIRKILVVDNVEGSRDLLEGLKDVLSPEDNQSLMDEVTDMVEDGNTVSVTSVSRSYENGLLQSICVGLRNETIGEKMYRTFNIGSTEKQEG